MDLYQLITIIIAIAAATLFINERTLKLPESIAVMAVALILSLLLIITEHFNLALFQPEALSIIGRLDFSDLVLEGILSFLLFAGALRIDLSEFKNQKWEISVLASLSTIASMFMIGGLSFYAARALGLALPLGDALLFGALISPTDPIAVLALFKALKAPKKLSIIVEGESLFNDGVGIVLFLTLYAVVYANHPVTPTSVLTLFGQEAVGGIAYGFVMGWLGCYFLKRTHDHTVQIILTLAIVTAGYTLAQELIHVSGPLAMVVAGMLIGNRQRNQALSTSAFNHLDEFWSVVDEVLNALLFFLIGLELLVVNFHTQELLIGLLAIPLVLLTRSVTVTIPMFFFKQKRRYTPCITRILIWGGLRGGLAIALALSLPASENRHIILAMTYAVVVFSIIVQGLSMKPLLKRALEASN